MLDKIGNKIVANINRRWPGELALFQFYVTYNAMVSNTHSAPKGKPQNFNRADEYPTGYPGWQGTLCVWLHNDPKTFGSSRIQGCGIYAGTGGYGNFCNEVHGDMFIYPLQWDCKIWADDFPEESAEILEHYKITIATMRLSGEEGAWEEYEYPQHQFLWKSQQLIEEQDRLWKQHLQTEA